MSEEQIAALVRLFYARIRADPMLGPLFNGAVTDWPEHHETLTDFWSSVMLTSGRYKGSPMAAHLRHAAAIEPAMFDRWLAVWREAAQETLSPADAAAVAAKAVRIAESLKLALYFRLPGRSVGAAL